MQNFVIPYKHEDLKLPPQEEGRFWVENPPDVNTVADAKRILKELHDVKDVCDHALPENAEKWFAVIESAYDINKTSFAIEKIMQKLLAATAKSKMKGKDVERLRSAIKWMSFCACFEIRKIQGQMEADKKEEKKKDKKDNAEAKDKKARKEQAETTELEAARIVLLDELMKLVQTPQPHGLHAVFASPPAQYDEDLLIHMIHTAIYLCEDWQRLKVKEVRSRVSAILTNIVSQFSSCPTLVPMTAAAVIKIIQNNDWAGKEMAEVVHPLAENPKEPAVAVLARNILVDLVQALQQAAHGSSGMNVPHSARNPTTFIVALTERAPMLMLRSVTLLLPFHSYDCYPLRSMLAEVIGHLLAATKKADDDADDGGAQHGFVPLVDITTRCQLLDILESRVLDKMSFTRAKVLHAWQTVAGCKHGVPRDRWRKTLEIVLGRLDDQSSSVRKAAMHALITMVDQHPYGALDNNRDGVLMHQVKQQLEEHQQQENPSEEDQNKIRQLQAAHVALEHRMQFATLVFNSTGQLVRLLGSKQPSDAVAAVDTIVSLRETGLLTGEWPVALSDTFALVWSGEEGVRHAAVTAFHTLYLAEKTTDVVAKGLVSLMQCPLTHGDLSSITEILKTMHTDPKFKDDLPTGLVAHLVHNDAPEALSVLAALADNKDIGAHTAALMYRARDASMDAVADVAVIAQATKHQQLVNECVKRIQTKDAEVDGSWFLAAQRTMDAYFHLAQDRLDSPDKPLEECTKDSPLDAWSEILVAAQGDRLVDLVRVLFLAGHLAVKGLIWCDAVRALLKRRRVQTEKAADMEGVGVAKDEAENEAFANLEEKLVNMNIYGTLQPHIVQVAKDATIREKCPTLAHVATLALCKYMVVSRTFCHKHLQLLFTLLFPKSGKSLVQSDGKEKETATSAFLRSDLTIACGDLLWRHPNVVEPWNDKLFGTLQDPEESTRFAGATVLTNLTLGDMVKPKGMLVFCMLRCTMDASMRVSRLARIFFRELNKKPGHIIYNCLPDLLSKLTSDPSIPEEHAHDHVQFLLGMIGKDKHIEQLVDKICARIREADKLGSRPVDLLSDALAQLDWKSEKCFMKLAECWSRDLHHILGVHEALRKNLRKIFLKIKRLPGTMKPEVKAQLEILDVKLREADGEDVELPDAGDQQVGAIADQMAAASVEEGAKDGAAASKENNPPSPARPAKRKNANGSPVAGSPPAKRGREAAAAPKAEAAPKSDPAPGAKAKAKAKGRPRKA